MRIVTINQTQVNRALKEVAAYSKDRVASWRIEIEVDELVEEKFQVKKQFHAVFDTNEEFVIDDIDNLK